MMQFDPANMALISAGAGMMDPTGTYGNAGAAINRGIQQGMKTYLPLAQFQAREKEAATRRKDLKEQNQFRNNLLEKQLNQAEKYQDATTQYRTDTINLERTKMERELKRLEQQQLMMGQFSDYAINGMPNPAAAGAAGPRVGNDPATGLPPGMPARVPMTPGQFGSMQAQMMSGTKIPGGAFTGLNKAAFPSTQPGSSNYSMSDRLGLLQYKASVGQITPEEQIELTGLQSSINPMDAAIAAKIHAIQ